METEKWRKLYELYDENGGSFDCDLYKKALIESFGESEEEASKNALEFVKHKQTEYFRELCDFD